MIISITNSIELKIDELPAELYSRVLTDLTIRNPAYAAALRQYRSTYKIPKTLELYKAHGDRLILPRGYGHWLMKHIREVGAECQLDDQRLVLPEVHFDSTIKLRDYQVQAVRALVKYRQGGVVAGCGSGKTVVMLEAMARVRQPALWVTHTQELADQVKQQAVEMLGLEEKEIGVIAGGKVVVGERLTVALVQTLSRANMDELSNMFGAVLVDEAHRMAAKSFYFSVGQFPALYRLWASATPDRSDGLTNMIFTTGGPILHVIDQCQVPTLTPDLRVVETEYQGLGEYTELISNLVQDDRRNSLIVRTIAAEARGNYSLVLSERIEHLEQLRAMLRIALPDMVIEILTGNMKKRERKELMDRVKNREVDILLATQLAREGLDILHLNRLFLTTPKRAAGATQQEIGRIMRPCEGKHDALVVDFWDSKSPMLKGQFYARREVYQKLGME
jgi:superfamily II DNA or RNA helicase